MFIIFDFGRDFAIIYTKLKLVIAFEICMRSIWNERRGQIKSNWGTHLIIQALEINRIKYQLEENLKPTKEARYCLDNQPSELSKRVNAGTDKHQVSPKLVDLRNFVLIQGVVGYSHGIE